MLPGDGRTHSKHEQRATVKTHDPVHHMHARLSGSHAMLPKNRTPPPSAHARAPGGAIRGYWLKRSRPALLFCPCTL